VVIGTTFGMMLANVPAVLFGERVTRIVPMRTVHLIAAGLFVVLGLMALFNVGGVL
jgi:putative Ca2+/H+ antiporter (TMEM165/GDT1 family)